MRMPHGIGARRTSHNPHVLPHPLQAAPDSGRQESAPAAILRPTAAVSASRSRERIWICMSLPSAIGCKAMASDARLWHRMQGRGRHGGSGLPHGVIQRREVPNPDSGRCRGRPLAVDHAPCGIGPLRPGPAGLSRPVGVLDAPSVDRARPRRRGRGSLPSLP